MRVASVGGRLAVDVDGSWVDVEKASNGTFGSDPQAIYDRWDEFTGWVKGGVDASAAATGPLDIPVPRPRQIFAVGLNYREHAIESKLDIPEHPVVFTKFQSSLTGPDATVSLPTDGIDWEVELVAVIGKEVKVCAVPVSANQELLQLSPITSTLLSITIVLPVATNVIW